MSFETNTMLSWMLPPLATMTRETIAALVSMHYEAPLGRINTPLLQSCLIVC